MAMNKEQAEGRKFVEKDNVKMHNGARGLWSRNWEGAESMGSRGKVGLLSSR